MGCEILFLPSERRIRIEDEDSDTTLLDATREAGLPIASACGANGACARCGVLILEGADCLEPETDREKRIKERNRIDPELRLACRIQPKGNLTVRAHYW